MAYYFKEIFGNLLLAEAIPNQPIEEGAEFPSPNTLKMKIILKGKISEFGDKETGKQSVKGQSLEGLNYAIPDESIQNFKNKISKHASLDINELDSDDKIIEIVDAIENVFFIQFR
uniref:1-phosphatidylinositol 4,5-bisphosphate phosphodiesterase beta-4 (Trinotate prediction) n=1 Tax=Myxobolus squamalis TaxID=59785 RepID=A0A6B2FWL2_MYXSQ